MLINKLWLLFLMFQLSEAVTSPLANTPSMATVGEDAPSHDCPSSPSRSIAQVNMETTLEVASLQERLTLLEEDNASLRVSCASLQHMLDQVS